jgi:AcrR family transcriptional regulator
MKMSRSAKPQSSSVAARSERRREEILERAIQLFARDGYADLDLQVLADDLNVGKGTLYRHFGSKQELFLAAADRVMYKLRHHIDASVEGIEDPLEQITHGIHAYLEYFDSHPEAVEMLIQERAQFKDRKRPTYFEHREANIERWRNLYRDLIAQGRIRPTPVERISDVVGDLLYGTMFVSYIAGRRRSRAQVADDIIDLIFNGILSDPERAVRARAKSPRPAKD